MVKQGQDMETVLGSQSQHVKEGSEVGRGVGGREDLGWVGGVG